jgi:hypothetical protein
MKYEVGQRVVVLVDGVSDYHDFGAYVNNTNHEEIYAKGGPYFGRYLLTTDSVLPSVGELVVLEFTGKVPHKWGYSEEEYALKDCVVDGTACLWRVIS